MEKQPRSIPNTPITAKQEPTVNLSDLAKAIVDATSAQKQSNSASSVVIEMNRQLQAKAQKQIEFNKRLINDLARGINCSMYAIPTIYREYQPSFIVAINGNTIKVPADGVARLIHNRFITIIEARLRRLDYKIESMRSGKPDIREDRSV
mgnify:CR=1 FL=1